MCAASVYAGGYDAGAYGYVGAIAAEVGNNSIHALSLSLSLVPSPVVAEQAEQTQVFAHGLSPRATDVATYCLVAVEGYITFPVAF